MGSHLKGWGGSTIKTGSEGLSPLFKAQQGEKKKEERTFLGERRFHIVPGHNGKCSVDPGWEGSL